VVQSGHAVDVLRVQRALVLHQQAHQRRGPDGGGAVQRQLRAAVLGPRAGAGGEQGAGHVEVGLGRGEVERRLAVVVCAVRERAGPVFAAISLVAFASAPFLRSRSTRASASFLLLAIMRDVQPRPSWSAKRLWPACLAVVPLRLGRSP
jgi:hypothetical protein